MNNTTHTNISRQNWWLLLNSKNILQKLKKKYFYKYGVKIVLQMKFIHKSHDHL